jgi:hypothetical protein
MHSSVRLQSVGIVSTLEKLEIFHRIADAEVA